MASSAKALMVMPGVTKAGFILGGSYGQGALRVNGKTERYYNLISGSAGFTIGAQEMDIILVFMTEKALEEFKSIDGWEAGVSGNVAIIDIGGGKRLDTTALKYAIVAFVFEPKGLMVQTYPCKVPSLRRSKNSVPPQVSQGSSYEKSACNGLFHYLLHCSRALKIYVCVQDHSA